MEMLQERIIKEGKFDQSIVEEQCIQQDLNNRAKQEEILWRQKSRIRWLKERDKNTMFFHNSMVSKWTHHIISLKFETRETLEKHRDFEEELRKHFNWIVTKKPKNREEATIMFLNNIPALVTQDKNNRLISYEEVYFTIKALPTNKALGPDGFIVELFQTCWPIICEEVWKVVEDSWKS